MFHIDLFGWGIGPARVSILYLVRRLVVCLPDSRVSSVRPRVCWWNLADAGCLRGCHFIWCPKLSMPSIAHRFGLTCYWWYYGALQLSSKPIWNTLSLIHRQAICNLVLLAILMFTLALPWPVLVLANAFAWITLMTALSLCINRGADLTEERIHVSTYWEWVWSDTK